MTEHLVILKGFPGCGKSHLAKEYAVRSKQKFNTMPRSFDANSEHALASSFRSFGEGPLGIDL